MLFFQALLVLFVYEILSTCRPFRAVHSTVKRWKVADKPVAQETIDRVCTAVNYACVWYPKRALCLQRSFRHHLPPQEARRPAQMVLGAQKLPFKAHAWVEVNGRAVNERSNVQATVSGNAVRESGNERTSRHLEFRWPARGSIFSRKVRCRIEQHDPTVATLTSTARLRWCIARFTRPRIPPRTPTIRHALWNRHHLGRPPGQSRGVHAAALGELAADQTDVAIVAAASNVGARIASAASS